MGWWTEDTRPPGVEYADGLWWFHPRTGDDVIPEHVALYIQELQARVAALDAALRGVVPLFIHPGIADDDYVTVRMKQGLLREAYDVA
jgi:hypothetical protein